MKAIKTKVKKKKQPSRKVSTIAESQKEKKPVGFKAIYRHIKRIPKGKVATYGDIALLCEERVSARTVGWALNVAPEDVPWHRVISHTGWLSIGRRSVMQQEIQRDLLKSEDVEFTDEFTVALDQFRWRRRKSGQQKKRAGQNKKIVR
ncbi:MAG TPA: MGMT family protein [Blastocatellia bacterium]|nr:MGMT family protein [Blastocatellia bacterium]